MKPTIVTSGATTCAEPDCKMVLVLTVGKRLPKFCFDHMPALYDEVRAVDVAP